MKSVKIGKLKVSVCENKGDLTYSRYVMFKQYAPQFWEKMDSPLFAVYWEKFIDHHNRGEHAQALMAMQDYKIAIDNAKNSYDAWGACFALITEIEDGHQSDKFKKEMNDADIKNKLDQLNAQGLKADLVKESVLNFMKASRETFMEHLTLYDILVTTTGIG